MQRIKVAIAHDFITGYGGAERVLASFLRMYPDADIYTLLYDKEKMASLTYGHRVYTSYLQKLPAFLRKRSKFLLPFFPRAVEEWDFSEYDLVLSSSNPFVKSILIRQPTKHICYMHAPMRYAWDYTHEYARESGITGGVKKYILGSLLKDLRIWDVLSSDRQDVLLANSRTTQSRISKYYRRDSYVVYPPVDVEKYKSSQSDDGYFYIISRLSPYKNIDVAIQVCEQLGLPLKIAGTGPDMQRLKQLSGSNTEFLGFVSDMESVDLMQRSRAFIFLADDDFGIAPVEAMAAGKPVLAWKQGGVSETVIEGKTGLFCNDISVESVKMLIQKFLSREGDFVSADISQHAQLFSEKQFQDSIKKHTNEVVDF
ncbi:MAG: glycosyltransferase [Patescibacteria group bacterium]|nr:glycosyltransferase [Patescibacteria group bacterium]